MIGHCPACSAEVEYEGSGESAACILCGRTKAAAQQAMQSRAEQKRDAKLKWVWIALGAVCTIVLLVFLASNGASDRLLGSAISAVVQVVLLAGLVWLVVKVKNWLGIPTDSK
jgi:uncharacterized integral membrane protein